MDVAGHCAAAAAIGWAVVTLTVVHETVHPISTANAHCDGAITTPFARRQLQCSPGRTSRSGQTQPTPPRAAAAALSCKSNNSTHLSVPRGTVHAVVPVIRKHLEAAMPAEVAGAVGITGAHQQGTARLAAANSRRQRRPGGGWPQQQQQADSQLTVGFWLCRHHLAVPCAEMGAEQEGLRGTAAAACCRTSEQLGST